MRNVLPKLIASFALAGAAAAILLAADAGGALSAVQVAKIDPSAMPIDLERGAPGLMRYLMALTTRASVLMITAHPDDEDGGMLAEETRRGARAALFSLNRGEGGQNAMSTDFYDAMGLMRTQELLQADRYYGVEQYWGTVIDYGFSKTREEALAKWGYERVLSDAVRVVRMTRPLIVTSVFVGAPTDGHGNHQVAGEMAQEVYLAAGDPNRFPEQIREGLRPWKPLKVYARVPIFAPTKEGKIYDYATDKYVPLRFYDYVNKRWLDKTPSTDVTVPEGTLDPSSGLTYLQIAREGWGYQKSQNGGGTIPPPSLYSAPYHCYGSRVPANAKEKSFYDGINVSLESIATLSTGGDAKFVAKGLTDISQLVNKALTTYTTGKPGLVASGLAEGLRATRSLEAQVDKSNLSEPGKSDIAFELEKKEDQFEKALTLALGVSFQATVSPEKEPSGPFAAFGGPPTTFTIAIPGQHFDVGAQVLNSGAEPVTVNGVTVHASDGRDWKISDDSVASSSTLEGSHDLKKKFAVIAPADATITKPYFSRPNLEQPYYDLTDQRFRNLSTSPYPLWAEATLSYEGAEWRVRKLVQTSSRLESIGIKQEPLLMAPALSVSVSPSAGAVPLSAASFAFTCTLQSNVKGPAKGTLRLNLPQNWKSLPAEYPFSFKRDGESESFNFRIDPKSVEAKRYEIRAEAEYDGKKYAEGYRLVGYPGLRPYPYYLPASYQATGVDVKTAPSLRVAFFPGTGDDVPRALENLGLQVPVLSASDLQNGNLSSYSAIVLGVRAYAARPDLRANNKALLRYVQNGGVLIVQYNLQDFGGDYAPYPLSLGSNAQKVVDENSRVKFLQSDNPALNWPNKISEVDFSDWQEERGHGFMEKWDEHYQALFETQDPDQDPQRGGLLIARYGKGFYVYDAFALYRQLPFGVPGAYRLLANLISLAENPAYK